MFTGEDLARAIDRRHERNPLIELHYALIRTFPNMPGDIQISSKTTAYPGQDGKAKVHDSVTVTLNTTISGAYTIANTLTDLLDAAKETRTK